jgi:hypothetical protein
VTIKLGNPENIKESGAINDAISSGSSYIALDITDNDKGRTLETVLTRDTTKILLTAIQKLSDQHNIPVVVLYIYIYIYTDIHMYT